MPANRRSVLAACTTGIGALAGCTSTEKPTADGSWSRRTLDNAHTGYATTAGPTTDLHTVWYQERPRSDGGYPSPVVDDGVLYLAYSQDGSGTERTGAWIEAFDAATGNSRWRTELFRTDESYFFPHSDSTVVDGDRLFVQTKPGLTMLTTDGEVQWTFDNLYRGQQIPDIVTPVVTDDVVVAGTYASNGVNHDETVYGIDPTTGEERWRTSFPQVERAMWQLAGTDDVVYVPFLGDGLVALDVATGDERWRWDGPVDGTPSVVNDLLLVPLLHDAQNHSIVALDRRDRSLRWQQSMGVRRASAGFTIAEGVIYHVADAGLEARRLETGEHVWRVGGGWHEEGQTPPDKPQFQFGSTPVIAGDAVYAPGWVDREGEPGYLFVVDAATGEEVDRVEMGPQEQARTATPAVTADLVFLTSIWAGTHLYAFGECSFEVAGRCLRG